MPCRPRRKRTSTVISAYIIWNIQCFIYETSRCTRRCSGQWANGTGKRLLWNFDTQPPLHHYCYTHYSLATHPLFSHIYISQTWMLTQGFCSVASIPSLCKSTPYTYTVPLSGFTGYHTYQRNTPGHNAEFSFWVLYRKLWCGLDSWAKLTNVGMFSPTVDCYNDTVGIRAMYRYSQTVDISSIN